MHLSLSGSQSQKHGKNKNFHIVPNIYGELSTTYHHFDYHPLVIARFQKAETSLLIAQF